MPYDWTSSESFYFRKRDGKPVEAAGEDVIYGAEDKT